MKDKLLQTFWDESKELLAALEDALLKLEKEPGDISIVNEVFRLMHTIKGSSSMFGYEKVSAFTHEMEGLYELVRTGQVPVSPELIDVSLTARDTIRAMIFASGQVEDVDNRHLEQVLSKTACLRKGGGVTPQIMPPPSPQQDSSSGMPHANGGSTETYRISFRPPVDCYKRGIDPVMIINTLRELGTCRVTGNADSAPQLDGIDPYDCHIRWEVELETGKGIDAIKDAFIFVEEDSEVKITCVEHSADTQCTLAPETVPAGNTQQVDAQAASSVRVASERLDHLVDLVGEIVTVQASLRQFSSEWEDFDILVNRADGIYIKPEHVNRLFMISERMDRLVDDLRDCAMGIRMLPIGTTFSRFQRLVRDLGRTLGKDVVLVTEGSETELDKTVIDKLGDPLVHLIRNAVDHGIESPAERTAHGKAASGTVRLSAEHSGSNVIISIDDDGRGIDIERLKASAVKRGIVSESASMTDREVLDLIFHPGFSTAEDVSAVSGRGVGMDAVKRAVEVLGGSLTVANNAGHGLRIEMALPLTMAIIDGLLVDLGGARFVFPLSYVEECVELTSADMENSHGRNIARVRGEMVPYINLREVFGTDGTVPGIQQIVIVRKDGSRYGFVVDQVVGQNQAVIKTLGGMYKDMHNISGASILGDGSIALILDISRIAAHVIKEEAALYGIGVNG